MQKSSLTDAEQIELGRLLTIVGEKDAGFIPDAAYRPMHKLVPWPAVEVLIHDNGRFILSHRNDDFVGWHIPGGFIKPGEGILEACIRNVQKEKICETVYFLRLISVHAWKEGEHPFGYPISLVIACKIHDEKIIEREDLRWFSEIPADIIPQNHPTFLRHFLELSRSGSLGKFAEIL